MADDLDGIIIVDNEGCITSMNSRAAEMFAYEPRELLGKQVEVLIPQRFRDAHMKHGEDYCCDPQVRPMGTGTHYALRKDGTEFPAKIALSPTWTNGALTVTATIRDASDDL